MISARLLHCAASGIQEIECGKTTLDDFLDNSAPAEFRRTLSFWLLTVFRRKKFLTAEITRMIPRAPEPRIRALLIAALAQIRFHSAVAPESAVNIAVECAKKLHADKLVNAVLRRELREMPGIPETPEEVLPNRIFVRWRSRFSPEQLARLTQLFLSEAEFTFHLEDGAELCDIPEAEERRAPGGFRFGAAPAHHVLTSPLLAAGKLYIQDPAAALAVSLAQTDGVRTALDLCAAPGGKSLLLSSRLPKEALLTAADRSANRQKLTEENFRKRGLKHRVLTATPEEITGSFDLVLADVPCSNTGVFRRRPDALWRFSERELRKLRLLQKEILEGAAKRTAPGGELLLSTCSIEEEEDQLAAREFCAEHPDFQLEEEALLLPEAEHDGAYAARFHRNFSSGPGGNGN